MALMWPRSWALALAPAVLVGHSMGCRVVIEAALQAPAHTIALVLIDGSQFAPAMVTTLKEAFSTPEGYPALVARWFQEMFTDNSDPAIVASVVERAGRLPRKIGEKVLLDMVRYDTGRLPTSLASLRVPMMAIQTTYSNERRERRSMTVGQTTPYLEMLRANAPAIRIRDHPRDRALPADRQERENKRTDRQFPRHAAGRRCVACAAALLSSWWLASSNLGGDTLTDHLHVCGFPSAETERIPHLEAAMTAVPLPLNRSSSRPPRFPATSRSFSITASGFEGWRPLFSCPFAGISQTSQLLICWDSQSS